MRTLLSVASLLLLAELAGAQCPGDMLMVRVSADGTCHVLDTSTPCHQLGNYLVSMHRPKTEGVEFEVDPASKPEILQAAGKSLKRAGYKKVGCVTNEIY